MTTKKERPLWNGPSNSERRALKEQKAAAKKSVVTPRKPKLSTLMALTDLNCWAAPVYEGDTPGDERDPLDLTNDRPFSKWQKGWHFLLSTDVVPDAKTYQPIGRSTKGKPRLKRPDQAPPQPSQPPLKKQTPRLWVGTCKPCGKHTIANSTYFLSGGACLHCKPFEKAQGNNLFLAGNAKLGSQLFFFTANNAAHAEAVRQERGYAWFVPVTTSKRNRSIDLPAVATRASPRPSADHWAAPVEDAEYLQYKPTGKTWLDEYGVEWAWYLVNPTETQTPEPEHQTAPTPPTLNSAGLVGFDDFM